MIAALLLLDLALGFLSRLVPQMNIFLVGFPLKIGLGLAVLAVGVHTAGPLLLRALDGLLVDFHSLMTWMRCDGRERRTGKDRTRDPTQAA